MTIATSLSYKLNPILYLVALLSGTGSNLAVPEVRTSGSSVILFMGLDHRLR